MNNEVGPLFFGLIFGTIAVAAVVFLATHEPSFTHDVGSSQRVCVIVAADEGNRPTETKCVTGQQIIEWLREKR